MKKHKLIRQSIKIILMVLIVLSLAILPAISNQTSFITGNGIISIGTSAVLAAQAASTVSVEPWGYCYVLGNGDIVEIGDSATTDFKAHIKTIRQDSSMDFSLWLEGGAFIPTLVDGTVSFDFNSSIHVDIYPSPPSERIPEGGIEYDIIMSKAPAKPTITLIANWNNVTWEKIYGLDIEYDQAKAYDSWYDDLYDDYPDNNLYGHDNGTGIFIITPTDVMTPDGQVSCIHRPEYEVNSYIGTCTSPTIKESDMGNGITYSTVSRSHLRIHRGQMTDALGETTWVENITLDKVAKTFTFTLPKTWLRNATYPVSQVCGVDPAYTEDMDSWDSSTYGSDGTWSDYDLFTNKGVPKGAVAEVILSNQEAGVEALTGIRTDGGSLNRYVNLHEAEGGGVTTCRMFVTCHATTGLVETYSQDISDANFFYLVGYWKNMTFTELATTYAADSTGEWADETLAVGASVAHHIIMGNNEDNTKNTMGVRANGSGLARNIVVHEPETGGGNYLDLMVNADAGKVIELYTTDTVNTSFIDSGYFTEMVFTELWQSINAISTGWQSYDLSAYLSSGTLCDFLLTHGDSATAGITMGARSGLDTTTNRSLVEQEAEGSNGDNIEFTGFGISALALDKTVYLNVSDATIDNFYLAGYMIVPLPNPPTDFISPSQTDTTIDLTWTKGANSDKTLIRFRDDQYPTSITDGTLAYFDTEESVTVGGATSIIQELSDTLDALYAGSFNRQGERVNNFPAANISRVSTQLHKLGLPTGTAYIRIRKVSDDSILETIGTKDVETLTTTPTWYDFDCNVDNPTAQDLRFSVEYNEGDVSNCVRVRRQLSDILAYALCTFYQATSWQDQVGSEFTIKIYYSITLTPATTYYFRAWGYQSATTVYSSTTADLTQATSGAGEADISNTPDNKNFGIVLPNQTLWSNGAEPSWPLIDGDALFTITNNGDPCSITIVATNFVGAVTWTLGTPAENVVRLTAFKEGDGSGDGKVLTTSPQPFISGLVADIDWELKFETPTTFSPTDGSTKTSTITLAATLD